MASGTSAVVGLSSSFPRRLVPPHSLKIKSTLLFSVTRRSFFAVGSRHTWSGGRKTMPEIVLFSSNSDQKSEDSEGSELSDESFLPPDEGDYLLKLVAGSVGGGAAIKYGSILFPDMTRPNLVQALLMISLPVLVASIILLKETYSNQK